MTGTDVKPWVATDMDITGISIVDPDIPIMLTPGITVSGVVGLILMRTRNIVTPSLRRWGTIRP